MSDTAVASGAGVKDLVDERAEVASQLTNLQEAIGQIQQQTPPAALPQHLSEQLELLKWLDLLYSNREALVARKVELDAELASLRKEVESLQVTGLTDEGPHSFLLLDDVRDQLNAEQSRRESIRLGIDAERAQLESERQRYENSEAKRRLTREKLEATDDPAQQETLTREYAVAKLASRAHGESVWQQHLKSEIAQLHYEISSQRSEYLSEKAKRLEESVQFSLRDLEVRLAMLDKAEALFQTQLAELQKTSAEVDRKWLEAKRELETSDAADAVAREAVITWKLARELQQEQISLLKQIMAEVSLVRICWRRRYEMANQQASAADIQEWHGWIETAREQVGRFQQLIEIRVDQRQGDLATLQKRLLQMQDGDQELLQWIQVQADDLERAIHALGGQLVLLKNGQRMLLRFADELDRAIEPSSTEQWLAQTQYVLQGCWNYEVASVDDRPITVSKIVRGLVMLLVGFLLARLCSRLLGKRVLPRFGVNSGASLAFQTIAFYVMLTCAGFLALELINVPITVFTFMGGAIAIGVGFGSQNVVNNFISGLILLAERPIRVGDLVDINGLNGIIEQIGARSTRVRTGTNLEIIVPNSKFLENNVTNLTLSDTRFRSRVSVGVAYGSPTREVTRLLQQAVTAHPSVLTEPGPVVLFKEFGDNALQFEVHFWIHMRTAMQGEAVDSEIRHKIDELFDEAQISIAFPQRDIHLDSLKPIEVNGLRVSRASGFQLGPIDLHLAAGSRTAIVGPSGCGKTTLLRCIAGLQEIDAGTVHLGDQLVSDRRQPVEPAQRRIGFVFQDGGLWPHMTALAHLRFANPRLGRAAAEALLARVDLGNQAKSKPGQLSGGEAQRLALARALATDPAFLLLDEPLHSVDAALRAQLAELIREVATARGLTLVLVTHDADEALAMCDDLLVVRDGAVTASGLAADMLNGPRRPFGATFDSLGEAQETTP